MKIVSSAAMALAVMALLVGSLSFAQAGGEATYKAKCLMCHGANGMAESPVAKTMKVKPVNDPEVKKLSLDAMIADVKNGKGKMPPFNSKLTDAQIKDSVVYYRSLSK